jgi:hypothetical protein
VSYNKVRTGARETPPVGDPPGILFDSRALRRAARRQVLKNNAGITGGVRKATRAALGGAA